MSTRQRQAATTTATATATATATHRQEVNKQIHEHSVGRRRDIQFVQYVY